MATRLLTSPLHLTDVLSVSRQTTGGRQDNNSDLSLAWISETDGAPAAGVSGINTFISREILPATDPRTFETIQVPKNGGNNGVGMIFDGLTFSNSLH